MKLAIAILSTALYGCGGDSLSPLPPCGGSGQACCPLTDCAGGLRCVQGICGGTPSPDGGGSDGAVTHCPGAVTPAGYVMETQSVPSSNQVYALDLDGDFSPDNQYGNLNDALAKQNLDGASTVQTAVLQGTDLELFRLDSHDAAFTSDDCAAVTLYPAMNQGNPNFSGSGTFTIDPGVAPASFPGALAGGAFSSPSVASSTTSIELPIKLAFGPVLVPVVLVGVHVQFGAPQGGLVSGQINGAIRSTDLQSTVIPQLASLLQTYATQNTGNPTGLKVELLFDNGGGFDGSSCVTRRACPGTPVSSPACHNPSGLCADACDGRIDPCEVANNSVIKTSLQPDVRLFAADGSFSPNPSNAMKDSLSVGFGFNAVKATF